MTFPEPKLEEAWNIYSPGIIHEGIENSLAPVVGYFVLCVFGLIILGLHGLNEDMSKCRGFDQLNPLFQVVVLLGIGLWLLFVLLFWLITWPIRHYLTNRKEQIEAQRWAIEYQRQTIEAKRRAEVEDAQRREAQRQREAAELEATKRADAAKRAEAAKRVEEEKQLIDEIRKMMRENQGQTE
jgi:F0F1-type ATP synthase membrane subunit b/b'